MTPKTLLLSIRREHADRIFSGMKIYELRRIRPRLTAGDRVIVYVPGPVKAVCGEFLVNGVLEAAPSALWKKVARGCGLTRTEFDLYFAETSQAFAISIGHFTKFDVPVHLARLRSVAPGFRPPQAYHYLQPTRRRDAKLSACW